MINPVEAFVKDNPEERAVNTYSHLAKTANVTLQVVTKSIKGVYPRIPHSVLEVMQEFSENTIDYDEWYSKWIDESVADLGIRLEKGEYEGTALFETPDGLIPEFYPSFMYWRQTFSDSLMGFCHDWKIPHATMIGYEAGKGLDLPLVLRRRLRVLLPITGKNDVEVAKYMKSLRRLPRR